MAKPIKETPILKGNDAIMFINNMTMSASKKATSQEKDKIKASFNKLSALANF